MGYGVMRADLAKQVTLLMTNSNSCTASFTQIAGVEALSGPQDSVHVMREEFRRRRAVIVEGLNRIPGFTLPPAARSLLRFPQYPANRQIVARAGRCTAQRSRRGLPLGNGFRRLGRGVSALLIREFRGESQKALERIGGWAKENL